MGLLEYPHYRQMIDQAQSKGSSRVSGNIPNLENFKVPQNCLQNSNFGARLLFLSIGLCIEVEGRGEGVDETSSAPSPHEEPATMEYSRREGQAGRDHVFS